MAKKKSARKSPAAKKTRKKQKRAPQTAAAPKKRKKQKRAPQTAAAPKKRKKQKRAPQTAAAPKKRKGSRKGRKHTHWNKVRSHERRTNPSIPTWAMVGLAGLAGLASYALYGAGSFALTQRIDPSMATLERNRYIAGGLATVLGGAVALLASPILGAGLFAGGLVSLVGTDLYLALGKVLDKAPAASAPAPAPQTTKGLFRGGEQQLGALAQGGQQILGIGGLYRAGQQNFGDVWSPAYQ